MGGAIAFEIAQLMQRDGAEVRALVMFDAMVTLPKWTRRKLRTIRALAKSSLKLGTVGVRLLNRLSRNPRERATLLIEGEGSDEELRGLLYGVSAGRMKREQLNRLSYAELYDEFIRWLEFDEAERREVELARLNVVSGSHPLRVTYVWHSHSIRYLAEYSPQGKYSGRFLWFAPVQSKFHDDWERHCTAPIEVFQYAFKDSGRGVHNSMMEPSNVKMYMDDLIRQLGSE